MEVPESPYVVMYHGVLVPPELHGDLHGYGARHFRAGVDGSEDRYHPGMWALDSGDLRTINLPDGWRYELRQQIYNVIGEGESSNQLYSLLETWIGNWIYTGNGVTSRGYLPSDWRNRVANAVADSVESTRSLITRDTLQSSIESLVESWTLAHEDYRVCITHGRYIFCRTPGEHEWSTDRKWIQRVRSYQTSGISGEDWSDLVTEWRKIDEAQS